MLLKVNSLIFLLFFLSCCKFYQTSTFDCVKINSKDFIDNHYIKVNGIIPQHERQLITTNGGGPVYGEILHSSLKILLDDLKVKNSDVFYDLGSGTGKVTLQAYLDYPFKKAVGIELSPTRCQHSINAKSHLEQQLAIESNRKLDFKNENILNYDINDATIIFMCSTCFPQELMISLTQKLSKLKKGLKLLSLKQLPEYEKFNFKLIKEYHLPMSWSKSSVVYLYELN